MERVWQWIGEHKVLFVIICIAFFAIPLLVVQGLFLLKSSTEILVAKWSAGELISYIAGFESFLGTVLLGIVTVYQTDKANKLSIKLAEDNNMMQSIAIQRMYPITKVQDFHIGNSSNHVYSNLAEKKKGIYYFEQVSSGEREKAFILQLCDSEEIKYMKIISLELNNVSEAIIKEISIDEIKIPGIKGEEFKHSGIMLFGEEKNKMKTLLLPGEKITLKIYILGNDEKRACYWEYKDEKQVGSFDLDVVFTNTSLTDVAFSEKIRISKKPGFVGNIVYDNCD